MKSLSRNVHSHNSIGQVETWSPSGFDVEALVVDLKQEQIMSVFRKEVTGNENKNGNKSALSSAGIGLDFKTWQPGEMTAQPVAVHKAEWSFIGPAGDTFNNASRTQTFNFATLDEATTQQQSEPEKETSSILKQARLQAEEIILAAQNEADNILLLAQEEINEQKKEGYQQGWDKASAEIKETLKATLAMVEEVRIWKTDLMTQGETILMEMLKEIAQKMFGEGVDLDANALQINLNRIMESVHGLGDLNIFLNPRDEKVLGTSWSEYQTLITGDKVHVVPSGKISRGGCFVKGNMGSVDGRVETQLEAILKSFVEVSELVE